ncbi:MAG TPA: hypothetical protein VIS77_15365 [Burkholderiales bacterium]
MLRALLRSLVSRRHASGPEVSKQAGYAARAAGDPDAALAHFLHAAHLRPGDAEAWNAAGMLHLSRGEPAEAIDALRQALAAPHGAAVESNYLYALLLDPALDADAILAAHLDWARRHADPLTARAPAPAPRPPDRRLRIGYVSPDFRKHVIAWFIEPVLRAHDRDRFEVYAYHSGAHEDAVTARLRTHVEHWRSIGALDDGSAAERIREDGIDILVDLAGHTAGGRPLLFARRPAPLQWSWLGYIGTTGMQAMDARISDEALEPAALAAGWYREALVRLPGSCYCYAASTALPEVGPSPAARGQGVTFASLNRIEKVSNAALDAWARLLQRVPTSRLRIAAASSRQARERIGARFAAQGIGAERIVFMAGMRYESFAKTYAGVDIALDAFPVNGASTTCEALWMGVPVVSLGVPRIGGRLGASVLGAAGCSEWFTTNVEAYIDAAARLAADPVALARTRAGLRARVSASRLADAAGFTRDLEDAYRAAARRAGWPGAADDSGPRVG